MTKNTRDRLRYLAIMLVVISVSSAAGTAAFLSYLCVYTELPFYAWMQRRPLGELFPSLFFLAWAFSAGTWLCISGRWEWVGPEPTKETNQ